jgi:hypothetical protein
MNTIWLFLISVSAFFYFVVLPTIVVGIVERCVAKKPAPVATNLNSRTQR